MYILFLNYVVCVNTYDIRFFCLHVHVWLPQPISIGYTKTVKQLNSKKINNVIH